MAARSLLLLAGVALAGCSGSREDALDALVAAGPISGDEDVWLAKRGMDGKPHRVALIYGVYGDLAFCLDVADAYMKKYPGSYWYCIPAGH